MCVTKAGALPGTSLAPEAIRCPEGSKNECLRMHCASVSVPVFTLFVCECVCAYRVWRGRNRRIRPVHRSTLAQSHGITCTPHAQGLLYYAFRDKVDCSRDLKPCVTTHCTSDVFNSMHLTNTRLTSVFDTQMHKFDTRSMNAPLVIAGSVLCTN